MYVVTCRVDMNRAPLYYCNNGGAEFEKTPKNAKKYKTALECAPIIKGLLKTYPNFFIICELLVF